MTEILLLTIDSLRKDYFTPEMFPNCWELLSSEFTQFTNCLANGVATPLSFPSIMTGRSVSNDGTLPIQAPTIAELYDGHTWGMSNNPHLRSERGYDRGFDVFSDTISVDDGASPLANIRNWASKFAVLRRLHRHVQSLRSPSANTYNNLADAVVSTFEGALTASQGLFWAHFEDPHYPFEPQKIPDRDLSLTQDTREIQAMNDRFTDAEATEEDIYVLQRCYEEQIKYLDRQLFQLFEHLSAEGRWDDSMIVIMSDHGEGFGEEGVFSHRWNVDPIDPLIRVPLAIKYPNGRHSGQQYGHLVQNADLLATFGSELGWDAEPHDRTYPMTDDTPRRVVSKSNTSIRVTTPSGYHIQRSDNSKVTGGTVTDEAIELARSESFPSVENLSGDVPELQRQERQELNDRLEHLGYK